MAQEGSEHAHPGTTKGLSDLGGRPRTRWPGRDALPRLRLHLKEKAGQVRTRLRKLEVDAGVHDPTRRIGEVRSWLGILANRLHEASGMPHRLAGYVVYAYAFLAAILLVRAMLALCVLVLPPVWPLSAFSLEEARHIIYLVSELIAAPFVLWSIFIRQRQSDAAHETQLMSVFGKAVEQLAATRETSETESPLSGPSKLVAQDQDPGERLLAASPPDSGGETPSATKMKRKLHEAIVEQRMGAILSLRRFAEHSRRRTDAQAVGDLLGAYLRRRLGEMDRLAYDPLEIPYVLQLVGQDQTPSDRGRETDAFLPEDIRAALHAVSAVAVSAFRQSFGYRSQKLRQADLRMWDLRDLRIAGLDLEGASFLNAWLDKVTFRDVNLDHAVFMSLGRKPSLVFGPNVSMRWVNFDRAQLGRVEFKGVQACEAHFDFCRFGTAIFEECDFSSAKFRWATLSGAAFGAVDLRHADFSGALLDGGADLSGVSGMSESEIALAYIDLDTVRLPSNLSGFRGENCLHRGASDKARDEWRQRWAQDASIAREAERAIEDQDDAGWHVGS